MTPQEAARVNNSTVLPRTISVLDHSAHWHDITRMEHGEGQEELMYPPGFSFNVFFQSSERVSCEFGTFRADTHLCKPRDTMFCLSLLSFFARTTVRQPSDKPPRVM